MIVHKKLIDNFYHFYVKSVVKISSVTNCTKKISRVGEIYREIVKYGE